MGGAWCSLSVCEKNGLFISLSATDIIEPRSFSSQAYKRFWIYENGPILLCFFFLGIHPVISCPHCFTLRCNPALATRDEREPRGRFNFHDIMPHHDPPPSPLLIKSFGGFVLHFLRRAPVACASTKETGAGKLHSGKQRINRFPKKLPLTKLEHQWWCSFHFVFLFLLPKSFARETSRFIMIHDLEEDPFSPDLLISGRGPRI